MKKSDLKDRMVVEIDNGERFMVVGDRIMANNRFILLDSFDDDLRFTGPGGGAIQRVYTKVAVFSQVYMGGVLRVLWSRTWEPKFGEKYYYPDFTQGDMFNYYKFRGRNDDIDNRMLGNGLVFKTKEEAIECAKKMLQSIKEDQ